MTKLFAPKLWCYQTSKCTTLAFIVLWIRGIGSSDTSIATAALKLHDGRAREINALNVADLWAIFLNSPSLDALLKVNADLFVLRDLSRVIFTGPNPLEENFGGSHFNTYSNWQFGQFGS
jgi:hypothetical protein